MKDFLRGKKAYIIAGATAAYAVLGYALGYLDGAQAISLLKDSGGLAALRAAIAKQ